jgi:predicted homoserine dehydrogenase-like protein
VNYQSLFSSVATRSVRAGVVGVGEFGVSLAARDRRLEHLSVSALADIHVDRACERLVRAGLSRDELAVCETVDSALAALDAGKRVIAADPSILPKLPLDVLVDATGDPETAARTADDGIRHGKHIVMASKEADSVVGPLLYRKARAAGLVYTPVDGDQPSLLIKLVSWARELGLEIIGAGKASEYDFVYEPADHTVTAKGRSVRVPRMRELWDLPDARHAEAIAMRAELLSNLPQKSAPDFCEMGIVANATGLKPDRASMHAPVARTLELPNLFCRSEDGGLFASDGAVDIFNCFRRADEASFAGGVFVVVDIHDDATFEVLKGKCIPASRKGSRLLLYNPTHLLGVEAPISILAAALCGHSSVAEDFRPRSDMVARAARDLTAGTVLAIGDHHTHSVADLVPHLVDAARLGPGQPLPYYMATGNRLARAVRAGEYLTADMVEAPRDSTLWRLRAEQDAAFFSAGSTRP